MDLHVEQFSLKTNWRLEGRLLYNEDCKKDPHGVGQEGKRNNRVRTCNTDLESSLESKWLKPHIGGLSPQFGHWEVEPPWRVWRSVGLAGGLWEVNATHEKCTHRLACSQNEGEEKDWDHPRFWMVSCNCPYICPNPGHMLWYHLICSTTTDLDESCHWWGECAVVGNRTGPDAALHLNGSGVVTAGTLGSSRLAVVWNSGVPGGRKGILSSWIGRTLQCPYCPKQSTDLMQSLSKYPWYFPQN